MVGRYYILLPFACLLLAACDPAYDVEMDIRNQSGHAVVLQPPADTNILYTEPWYWRRDGIAVEADSCIVIHLCGGLGSASREEAEWQVSTCLVPDSAVFVFDDGRRLVYYSDDTLTEGSPYKFSSSQYDYSEKIWNGLVFNGLPYYGSLTYTITKEQYEQSN